MPVWAGGQDVASWPPFIKQNAGYLEEGVPLKQAGKELMERRKRNQWPGSQKGCERKAQHQCSVEVRRAIPTVATGFCYGQWRWEGRTQPLER